MRTFIAIDSEAALAAAFDAGLCSKTEKALSTIETAALVSEANISGAQLGHIKRHLKSHFGAETDKAQEELDTF